MLVDNDRNNPGTRTTGRRAGGSIEDRIKSARERRKQKLIEPTPAPEPQADASIVEPPSPRPARKKRRRPVLFGLLLAGLLAGLVTVALLPPVEPPLPDIPPVVVADTGALQAPPEELDAPNLDLPIRAQAFRLRLAPYLPVALRTEDPTVLIDAPIRAPQPPTESAPARSERPRTKPEN